jgi:hypothetical protein
MSTIPKTTEQSQLNISITAEERVVIVGIFEECYNSFKSKQDEKSQDVEVFISPSPDRFEVNVLFDEVFNRFSAPDQFANGAPKAIVSQERNLINENITQRAVLTARIVKVKEVERRKRAEQARSRRTELLADQQLLITPPFLDRIGAGLVDLFFILATTGLFSVVLSLLLYRTQTLDLFSILISQTSTPSKNLFSNAVVFLGLYGGLLPNVATAYYLIFLLATKTTPGYTFGSIVLTDGKGGEPQQKSLLVKAILMPLSFILLGFITPFLGNRSFSDLLSNTRTITNYSSQEELESEI